MNTASVYWHAFLKQLTHVSLALPVSVEFKCVSTVACSNQTQLAPCVPHLWLLSQASNPFLGSSVDSGHIIRDSESLPIDNEYQLGPLWYPANCQLCKYFHPNSSISKNDPSLRKEFSNELIINERVRGLTWDIGGIEIRTLTIPPQQTPSQRSQLSTDSHSQIASDKQYSRSI